MANLFLIFIGCGFGGLARYGVSVATFYCFQKNFPLGTLVVNVTGSFLMGLLFAVILERYSNLAQPLRAFLLIGFLGGYTTFSSFAVETLNLYEMGALWAALSNIILSVVLCLMAVWLGMIIGRQI